MNKARAKINICNQTTGNALSMSSVVSSGSCRSPESSGAFKIICVLLFLLVVVPSFSNSSFYKELFEI